MEARMFLCGIGLLAAFSFAFALARDALSRWARRCSSMDEELGFAAIVHWRMRNGVPLLLPMARALLSHERVATFAKNVREGFASKGIKVVDETVLTLVLALSGALAIAAWLLSGSIACLFLAPLCTVLVLDAVAGNLRRKKRFEAQESIPAALESMSVCFGSGFTLQQTFQQVAKEVEGPLGALFASASHALETGVGADEALSELRDADIAGEMSFVVVALDIQHQTGGSIKQVLDAAADGVKGEIELRRSLRVQTAQAELSARIVSVMPIVLLLMFSLISPSFLNPFFSSAAGWILLGFALTMQVAGIVLVRRALHVEGV